MDPVAINLFGLEVRWYGILIALGMLVAISFAYFVLKKDKDYDENTFFNLIFLMIPLGLIGARLYYVLFNLSTYSSLWEALNFRSGGLAFHGGILVGIFVLMIYGKRKKINRLRYLDVFSVGVLFAQGLGRFGNFFNQEAHGGPVSKEFISKFPVWIQEGMYIDGVYYHPTFLYESINDLVWFTVLAVLILKKTKLKTGTIFALAVFGNSLGRFFIEGLRTDSLMLGTLRIAQIVGLVGMIFSVCLVVYLYKFPHKSKKKK